MTFCGANNDFLGKLCYQSLPGEYSGYDELQNRYWISWLLTFSTFLVCSLAMMFGWNGGSQFRKMRRQFCYFMLNVSIPATCDVFVNLGRYIGLVFLPASVVTVLKNGTQLLFSALIRVIFEKKTLSLSQWGGILLVVIGLGVVSLSSFLHDGMSGSPWELLGGIAILVLVGLFGSIRNHYEQIVCRDLEYGAKFVVGARSIISAFWTLLIAVVLLSVPMLYDDDHDDDDEGLQQNGNGNGNEDDGTASMSIFRGWLRIEDGVLFLSKFPLFLISLVLFYVAIYGKNVTQMKVIEMSSALTRNLTMQLMPIGTWILSLTFYYVDPRYGEQWNQYSYIRLIGFIIVLIGSYLYMKVPKIKNDKLKMSLSLQESCVVDVSANFYE